MTQDVHGFSHEAFFYEGMSGFLEGAVAFIDDGLARDEAVLVAVLPHKRALLQEHVDDPRVAFLDMERVGRNPACIIPAWRDFVAEHAAEGRRFRGIGEPVWPERGADELDECHRHEALLNLAFDDGPAWRLLCPYDAAALSPEDVEHARRSHPLVWEHGRLAHSDRYAAPAPVLDGSDDDLRAPAGVPERVAFGRHDLAEVRRVVARHALQAGLEAERAEDLTLAVCELATNSVLYAGGTGTLAVWRDDGALVCEVRDAGRIADPLIGRARPTGARPEGRGMWLVNQACDLVQVRSLPDGNVVRVRVGTA
jgi:anti-sigma regulatory factor (Ser/Thr protein kinase)